MTPALKMKFKKSNTEENPEAGLCAKCLVVADMQHIFWDCPRTEEIRKDVLNMLPQDLKPSCLKEWILPQGAPEHRKAVLDSLTGYIKSAGLAHYI